MSIAQGARAPNVINQLTKKGIGTFLQLHWARRRHFSFSLTIQIIMSYSDGSRWSEKVLVIQTN